MVESRSTYELAKNQISAYVQPLAQGAIALPFESRDQDGRLLIGVNTRNLRTLEVDGDRLERFSPLLPEATCVAESGLCEAADAAKVAGWGYTMALVGTALMRSDDPAALIAAMREAGAAACS